MHGWFCPIHITGQKSLHLKKTDWWMGSTPPPPVPNFLNFRAVLEKKLLGIGRRNQPFSSEKSWIRHCSTHLYCRSDTSSVADPGFPGGVPTLQGERQPIILQFFSPKTAWRLKNFCTGGASLASPWIRLILDFVGEHNEFSPNWTEIQWIWSITKELVSILVTSV